MSDSSTPSIRISEHQHQYPCFQRPPRDPTTSAAVNPMAIPRAEEPAPPPPLPPPHHIPELAAGQDPGWQWGQDSADFGRPAPVRQGSSLLGGRSGRQDMDHEYPPYQVADDVRRGSSISTITANRECDMQDGSLTPSEDGGRSTANYRLHGERQLEQRTLEHSSNSYDKQLLSRIGGPNGPNTPKRTSVSSIPPSVQETAQLAHAESERWSGQLRPLSMPDQRHASLDSPAPSRWPSSGAISPSFTGAFFEQGSNEHSRHQSVASRHASLTFEDSISQRGSYDQSMFNQGANTDDGPMGHLHLHDRSSVVDGIQGARAGMKRRADSPPRELGRDERTSVSSTSGAHEMYHRRSIQHLPSRDSPVNRHHSSLSSASSQGPRHGSLGSSLGVASITSSATSYGSGRVSPSGLSPAFDPENRTSTPYNAVHPLSNAAHQRVSSESRQGGQQEHAAESAPHSRNGSVANSQGAHACECCPKKPKRFDTIEDLRMHESEKQYSCAYCPNRFKNKNEAERHQNSLHLRRHSWSCAVLAGAEAAFHASQSASGTDLCGYCGEEFPNPPQWDVRAEHLNQVHKFGECNQAKKFFRADHFRQHLKHSHQGTSGKWTNQLEIACMKDEPLPEKRAVIGPLDPPAPMASSAGQVSARSD